MGYTPIIIAVIFVFCFGLGYSTWIATHPPADNLTWLSVVVGVAGTIIPYAIAVWYLTHDWLQTILIFVFFVASGGPMIAGQVSKYWLLRNHVEEHNGTPE